MASIEAGGAYALAFASGSSTTATVLQSLGSNAHVVSVNDVYGGTFRYMRRVAAEGQGLETTFLDLENASDDEIIASIRNNTKVFYANFFFSIAPIVFHKAYMDRISYKPYTARHRYQTHCSIGPFPPFATLCSRR